jgi:type III secretory pathway component EscT
VSQTLNGIVENNMMNSDTHACVSLHGWIFYIYLLITFYITGIIGLVIYFDFFICFCI